MARIVVTDAKLQAIKPRAQRFFYTHGLDRGLYLRVEPTGRKTWHYRYKVAGRASWLALGQYGTGPGCLSLAEARTQLEERRKQAEAAREGTAPEPRDMAAIARAERLAEPTVADLAARWLKAPGKKGPKAPATIAEYKRMLDRDVLPQIGALRVAHVKRQHVNAVLDKVAERGRPVATSEVAKLLRAMFRHAQKRAELAVSPMAGMEIQPAEREKDRKLSDAELRAFFRLIDGDATRVGRSTALCLRWVLLTACRPGEARGARWSDIDLDAGTWTIPATRTKNRRTHVVALSDAALAAIAEARSLSGGQHVFPGLGDDAPLGEQVLSHAIRRLRDRLAQVGVAEPFTPHDLRRTATTIVTERLGFGRFVASLILGHVSETEAGATAIYDRADYSPVTTKAWQALGDHVHALRTGATARVVGIRTARKRGRAT